jgi:DNA-binding NtrC family response regulator
VETAADGFKALGRFSDFEPDLVLTDLKMPGMDGLELLKKVREADMEIAVVLMTAFGAVETAVEAMRQGAADYLTKPLNTDELLVVLERALERRKLRRETVHLRAELADRYRFENIVGTSPEMQNVFKIVAQVAPSRATVLLTGESGTGKELVAAAIHHRSSRRDGPFIRLHCAALAESLLESELFGHERGAYTGADRRREGRFEQAHGGTLFLDEISEISPATQVKLLRVLQEREFERVGGNQTIRVDVRLIAATNRDLKKLADDGKFRQDLFYRLNVINITLPSLRQRSSDIPALAMHFLERYARENEKVVTGFVDEALTALAHYPWPGNVRELENVVERALVLAEGDVLEASDLPMLSGNGEAVADADAALPEGGTDLTRVVEGMEERLLRQALSRAGGVKAEAARLLGLKPSALYYKLEKYGIEA